MGYKRESKTYNLVFKDTAMAGLEVLTKSCPTGVFLEMASLVDVELPLKKEDEEKVQRLFDRFADRLVSWNLEDDDDQPIPATIEGLYSQDLDFILQIILAWLDAVGGVTAPLGQPSTSGSRSLEEQLPMDPLSASLSN
jgi:hypothetical protein